MKIHANAGTCLDSHRLLVRRIEEENQSACKWLGCWWAEGAGCSIAPRRPGGFPHRTLETTVEASGVPRRLRMAAAEVAEILCLALSTVSVAEEDRLD